MHHRLSWIVPIIGLSLVAAAIAYASGIAATRRLGAKLASFVGLTEVLFAVLFAWAFLGQAPGAMAAGRRRRGARRHRPGARRRQPGRVRAARTGARRSSGRAGLSQSGGFCTTPSRSSTSASEPRPRCRAAPDRSPRSGRPSSSGRSSARGPRGRRSPDNRRPGARPPFAGRGRPPRRGGVPAARSAAARAPGEDPLAEFEAHQPAYIQVNRSGRLPCSFSRRISSASAAPREVFAVLASASSCSSPGAMSSTCAIRSAQHFPWRRREGAR